MNIPRILTPLALLASGAASAECGYIYVDNTPNWVCDYTPEQAQPTPCHYIYVNNEPIWVCHY
jgi:hypothetical protein